MEPDKHAARNDGVYPMVSLYLDSDDLRLYRESVEGRKNRFKLRIRSYTDDLDYPRFFEIKRRVNSVVAKSSAPVGSSEMIPLLSGRMQAQGTSGPGGRSVDQFVFYMKSIFAKPLVRVRYMRQAFESFGANDLRITFDRELCTAVTQDADVRFHEGNWQRVPVNGVVMEIKFTGCYPSWVCDMVKTFGLQQRSFCKYVTGVRQASLLGFCAPKRTSDRPFGSIRRDIPRDVIRQGVMHGPIVADSGRSVFRRPGVFAR